MTWPELEAGAPEIASLARERFTARDAALLGTLRADGWPRISPVEPFFLEGELVFGIMASPKLDDLRADPRCVLHSVVVDSSGAEPEVKLTGRALASDDPAILAAEGTWWASRPPDSVAVFRLEIEEAVAVAWDTDFGRMRASRWRRGGHHVERERTYP